MFSANSLVTKGEQRTKFVLTDISFPFVVKCEYANYNLWTSSSPPTTGWKTVQLNAVTVIMTCTDEPGWNSGEKD
jgi:hypothetical protein